MKFLLITIFMLSVSYSRASIEFTESKQAEITPAEIARNHACFQELAAQGCGDPGEDHKHFRTCLHDSYQGLSEDCQKMMSRLYSRKK